jgi:hypothetical protein
MQGFLDLFISINCSTCFRPFHRPSSGAQNCTYSVRYFQINTVVIVDELEPSTIAASSIIVFTITDNVFTICAPDGGRRNRLKHVEQCIEINISRKRCILLVYFGDITISIASVNVFCDLSISKCRKMSLCYSRLFNLLAPEFYIYILAHPVCKM